MFEWENRVCVSLFQYNMHLEKVHHQVWEEAYERLFLRQIYLEMESKRRRNRLEHNTETMIRVVTGKLEVKRG